MSFTMNQIIDDSSRTILNDTFLGTNNSNVSVANLHQHSHSHFSNAFHTTTTTPETATTVMPGYQLAPFATHYNPIPNYVQADSFLGNITAQNVVANISSFLVTTVANALVTNTDARIATATNYSSINSLLSNNVSIYDGNDNIIDPPIRLEHAPQLSKSAIIRCVVLSAMAIVSLLGNTATMWNIYKTRMTKRPSRHNWSAIYSLIFHLSIADVLVTGFCIIGEAAWCYTVQWMANEFACKSVKFFQMFSLYLSTYVLVLIGVDRWIAVKYPMKSLNMAKRCYRLLGGAYVLSFILSTPQFFIFRVARGPFIEDFYQCVTHGFYTAEWQEQLYTTFTLFFTFIIPLCILIITYLSTFRTISGSEKMFQGSKLAVYTSKPAAQTNRQRLIHKAKMKSLRISVVIIVAFLICWTPYNVMMIIFMFLNPDKRLGEDLQSGIFFFGMSNSLVNPLIYGAFHLCPLKRNNSQYAHYSLTRDNSHSYQRSPSLLTATTQVDSNGRHQTFKHRASYYHQRNGSMIRRDHFDLTNSPATKKLHTVQAANCVATSGISDVNVHLNSNNLTNPQREYLLRQTSFNGVHHPHHLHHKTINSSLGGPNSQLLLDDYNNGNNHANNTISVLNDSTIKKTKANDISSV